MHESLVSILNDWQRRSRLCVIECACRALGIPYEDRAGDPELFEKRYEVNLRVSNSLLLYSQSRSMIVVVSQLIVKAASRLDECQMIRFEEHSGAFGITDLGRVASHFYIQVRRDVFDVAMMIFTRSVFLFASTLDADYRTV